MKTLLLCIVLCLAFGCENAEPPPTPASEPMKPSPRPSRVRNLSHTSAGKLLAELDADIAFWGRRASEDPSDWLAFERVAGDHQTRARLTGDWSFYADAEKAISAAFKAAPDGSGPFLARAGLNFSIHRFGRVEADLENFEKRIRLDNKQRAHVMGMRGDLAVQKGDLKGAMTLYDDAIAISKSASTFARKAVLLGKMGKVEEADRLLQDALRAAKTESPMTRAWVHLQRGLLDLQEERWDEALEHYQQGRNAFDGWYLIDEHIAEVRLKKGQVDIAEQMYLDITARSPRGEFMDALTTIMAQKGNKEAADLWADRAAEAFERDLKQFPSAAYGHALQHYLKTDPKRALVLARKNIELRPGPEAQVALIRALRANQELDEAAAVLAEVKASGWTTVGL